MSSEPPVATPEIEKALQLQHTMDEISGQLTPSKRYFGHEELSMLVITAFGILALLALIALSPACGMVVAGIVVVPLALLYMGTSTGPSTNSYPSPQQFILTRTSLALGGVDYAWTRVRECAFDRTDLFLTLTLKDGQQIQWGPFSTEHHDSLQWFCELINHRAGLAGDEAEIPEDIKAMRRQKDSV